MEVYGQIGTQNANEVSKKSESFFSRHASMISDQAGRVSQATDRLDMLADRLFGSTPVDAGVAGSPEAAGVGHMQMTSDSLEELISAITRLETAVSRISDGLS